VALLLWQRLHGIALRTGGLALAAPLEFMVNEDGRFVVVLPEGGEYRSQILPELHLDLAEFWSEVGKMLP
jgi:hypothetical protein